MEIRFNTTNEKVEKALEQIRKNERKYFVEEAIVHYLKYLEVDELATSLFLDVNKSKHVLEKENDNIEQSNIQDEETEGNDNLDDNDEYANW